MPFRSGKQTNSPTGGGPAFSAVVKSGATPFTVSSSTKVQNLNADKLDGIDSTGFLRANHVLHGAGNANGPGGKRLFLDPATGVDIREHLGGEVEIRNTNASDHLLIDGISTCCASDETHWSQEVAPGESAILYEQTIDPFFVDVVVTRLGAQPAQAVSLHLTCAVADNTTTSQVALSCLGVG